MVISVLVAVLLALATWSAGLAADRWQSAARDETKAGTTTTETVRYVYVDEAPIALDLTRALIRADELDRAAAAFPGGPATAEAATTRKTAAERMRTLAAATDPGLMADRYQLPDHAFDINRRLGDLLADSADLRDQPAVDMADGDRLARLSRVLMVVPILLVGIFIGVRALGHERQRRAASHHAGEQDVGLIPQPWSEPARVRLVSATALVAWVLLTVLTALQLSLSSAAARADASASRLATSVTATVLASQLRASLTADAVRTGIDLSMSGLARQFVAVTADDPRQEAIGVADTRSATTWADVAAGMTAKPSARDGLDAISVAMIGSDVADWKVILSAQNDAARTAATNGSAANLASLGLLLAALSATTASAAKVRRRPRRPAIQVALTFLVAAVVAGVSAIAVAL